MGITTVFDPDDYIKTTLEIIKEFLDTYITDVDIRIVRAPLETPLTQPVIRIYIAPGSFTTDVGMGKSMGTVDSRERKGEFKNLVIGILVSTDDATDGEFKRDELSGKLEKIILQYGHELAEAGLKKPKISPPVPMDTENLFGAFHELLIRPTIYFED